MIAYESQCLACENAFFELCDQLHHDKSKCRARRNAARFSVFQIHRRRPPTVQLSARILRSIRYVFILFIFCSTACFMEATCSLHLHSINISCSARSGIKTTKQRCIKMRLLIVKISLISDCVSIDAQSMSIPFYFLRVLNRLASKKQDKQHDTLPERDSCVSRNRHGVSLIPRISMRGAVNALNLSKGMELRDGISRI